MRLLACRSRNDHQYWDSAGSSGIAWRMLSQHHLIDDSSRCLQAVFGFQVFQVSRRIRRGLGQVPSAWCIYDPTPVRAYAAAVFLFPLLDQNQEEALPLPLRQSNLLQWQGGKLIRTPSGCSRVLVLALLKSFFHLLYVLNYHALTSSFSVFTGQEEWEKMLYDTCKGPQDTWLWYSVTVVLLNSGDGFLCPTQGP